MLYDHHAISFADRTGQSCQRLWGGRAETAQSLCNLHNLHTKTGCCSRDVLADSLQEPTISWGGGGGGANDYLKSSGVVRSASGARTDIIRSTCSVSVGYDLAIFQNLSNCGVKQNGSGYDARACARKG